MFQPQQSRHAPCRKKPDSNEPETGNAKILRAIFPSEKNIRAATAGVDNKKRIASRGAHRAREAQHTHRAVAAKAAGRYAFRNIYQDTSHCL